MRPAGGSTSTWISARSGPGPVSTAAWGRGGRAGGAGRAVGGPAHRAEPAPASGALALLPSTLYAVCLQGEGHGDLGVGWAVSRATLSPHTYRGPEVHTIGT